MKKYIILLLIVVGLGAATRVYAQNLPVVNRAKQTFNVYMADNDDDTPLIYGYETPVTGSKKMICFSSFTADVENNPHKCALGAYYTTDDITIKYITVEGDFVKLQFEGKEFFYIEKKFVKFE